jgi:hypothetical protein
MGISKMSKMTLLCLSLAMPLGSVASAMDYVGPMSSQIETVTTSQPNREIARECYAQARTRHSHGTFSLNRYDQSPAMRRHRANMSSFCSAYDGQKNDAYWAQLRAETQISNTALAFSTACKAEVKNGRTVIFRPTSQHIARMNSICETMAADIASN